MAGEIYTVDLTVRVEHIAGPDKDWDVVAARVQEELGRGDHFLVGGRRGAVCRVLDVALATASETLEDVGP